MGTRGAARPLLPATLWLARKRRWSSDWPLTPRVEAIPRILQPPSRPPCLARAWWRRAQLPSTEPEERKFKKQLPAFRLSCCAHPHPLRIQTLLHRARLCHKIFYWKKKVTVFARGGRGPSDIGTRLQAEPTGCPGGLRPWWPEPNPQSPTSRSRCVPGGSPAGRAGPRRGGGAGEERGVNARGALCATELRAETSSFRRTGCESPRLEPRSALGPGSGFRVCVLPRLAPIVCIQDHNKKV